MTALKSFPILATICLVTVKAARYEFLMDNDAFFDDCPEMPGINEMFDLSEFKLEIVDGRVHCSGNVTSHWQGIEPTDRIELHAEVLKFQRGVWQPTPLTIAIKDFCKKQFSRETVVYQMWTSYIPADERKCINNFGQVYHHRPFVMDTIFEFVVNMEGQHKVVVTLAAYDKQNVMRPNSLCFQLFGEFIKVK